jgi:4-amino-4-deoxychorismate lyase
MMLIDGRPPTAPGLAPSDRGLQYGDGLFETLAINDGRACHWPLHYARLDTGCARLGIPTPARDLLEAEIARLCAGAERAVLKLIVTRGVGARGYRPPVPARPTRILQRLPWPEQALGLAERGIDLRLCNTRLGLNPALAGVKHLNRLEQVMARAEWGEEYHEGLMFDVEDRVVEGTMSNLFLVRRERLCTPSLAQAGVAGVTRARVLRAAREMGIECSEEEVREPDLYSADGLFVTNSLIGIWPVARLEGTRLRIPAMTQRLAELLGPPGSRCAD